jgi:nitrogen-specific signal transduction histidine kinase
LIQTLKRGVFRLVAYVRSSTRRDDLPRVVGADAPLDRTDVAIAAHDCLTLLDIMIACANAMHGLHPGTRVSDDDIVAFYKAADRMRHLARGLIADLPAHNVQKTIDVNRVITESEGLVSRLLPAGTELRLELADMPAMVTAGRWEIERILLNLVLNACRRLQDRNEIVIQTASMKQVPPGLTSSNIRVRSYITLTISAASATARHGARVIANPWNVERQGSDLTLAAVARTVQQLEGTLQLEINSDRHMRVRVDLPLAIDGSDNGPEAA